MGRNISAVSLGEGIVAGDPAGIVSGPQPTADRTAKAWRNASPQCQGDKATKKRQTGFRRADKLSATQPR